MNTFYGLNLELVVIYPIVDSLTLRDEHYILMHQTLYTLKNFKIISLVVSISTCKKIVQ